MEKDQIPKGSGGAEQSPEELQVHTQTHAHTPPAAHNRLEFGLERGWSAAAKRAAQQHNKRLEPKWLSGAEWHTNKKITLRSMNIQHLLHELELVGAQMGWEPLPAARTSTRTGLESGWGATGQLLSGWLQNWPAAAPTTERVAGGLAGE